MNGIIIVNKDEGLTSHDVVARLRRLLHEKRIGHAGTLDPMATGVLPVCVGKSTRLVEYISDGSKTYIADICFGIETDSYDRQGEILKKCYCSHLSRAELEAALMTQQGDIQQIPPMVSAIKIGGQPLYKLAREGKTVERTPRAVKIHSIKILEYIPAENPRIICEICCSKGTYIRSIAHDVGEILGCGAHLQALQRSRVGDFGLENAYSIEEISNMLENDDFSFLLPPEAALKSISTYQAEDKHLHYILHGNSCRVDASDCPVCAVYDQEGLIGMGHIEKSILYMDKVLREL